jgi:hypothetical protein
MAIKERRCSYSSRFSSGWNGDAMHLQRRRTDKTEYFDFTAKLFNWRKTKQLFILEK